MTGETGRAPSVTATAPRADHERPSHTHPFTKPAHGPASGNRPHHQSAPEEDAGRIHGSDVGAAAEGRWLLTIDLFDGAGPAFVRGTRRSPNGRTAMHGTAGRRAP
ncbi:hypothetical protein WBG99_14575 [Streptomyces sp. TG1A-60]|uniref:hypothetical protein n=1 Tax=Streptomyces sp. TG1A-60 TaxID=3129111 RepID=UPI0030D3E623